MIKNSSKLILIIPFCILFGCGRIENNSAQDYYSYGPKPEGSVQFNSVRTFLSQQCATCHTHASWNGFSQDDFINAQLVIPQTPEASPLYYRNQGATTGPGNRNMPFGGGAALTTQQLLELSNWINSI